MNTFQLNKRFYILLVLVFLLVENFLILTIFDRGNPPTYFNNSIDEKNNKLGENYITDFLKYKCKSIKRYGVDSADKMYRIDGTLTLFSVFFFK